MKGNDNTIIRIINVLVRYQPRFDIEWDLSCLCVQCFHAMFVFKCSHNLCVVSWQNSAQTDWRSRVYYSRVFCACANPARNGVTQILLSQSLLSKSRGEWIWPIILVSVCTFGTRHQASDLSMFAGPRSPSLTMVTCHPWSVKNNIMIMIAVDDLILFIKSAFVFHLICHSRKQYLFT